MKTLSSKKNLIISIVVIVVIAVLGYWYFSSNSSSNEPILSNSTVSSSDTLLSTLNELKSLSLNSSIFTEASFEALTNNTVTLPTVASGRPNPFAPLPGLVGVTTGQGSVIAPTH